MGLSRSPASFFPCTSSFSSHFAGGLVGSYWRAQREGFYRRIEDGTNDEEEADFERVRTERTEPGDYYGPIPPNNDIHSVETTSDEPSVSIRLLGVDVGCVKRCAFDG